MTGYNVNAGGYEIQQEISFQVCQTTVIGLWQWQLINLNWVLLKAAEGTKVESCTMICQARRMKTLIRNFHFKLNILPLDRYLFKTKRGATHTHKSSYSQNSSFDNVASEQDCIQ